MSDDERPASTQNRRTAPTRAADDFGALSRRILHYVGRGMSRIEFLREVSGLLLDFSECDVVELWLKENHGYWRCEAKRFEAQGNIGFSSKFQILPHLLDNESDDIRIPGNISDLQRIGIEVVHGHLSLSPPLFTRAGTFWTGDSKIPFSYRLKTGNRSAFQKLCIGGDYPSLVLTPLVGPEGNIGLLQLKSRNQQYFTKSEIVSYEHVSQNLALAILHQRTQAALHERIKELTCLYGITQISTDPDLSLEVILERIVELLPPSWQYPDIASASITLDGRHYSVSGFQDRPQNQTADIVVRGEKRGVVKVVYDEERPDLDEGPFLKEERGLIDAVARQVALMVERRRAEEERLRLQDQLRHADRLATIGQLAAGVAHELNEPLGNILGFAQLAKKSPGLPEQATKDMEKIINSCLHARQVIQKLMMFARQTPPKKTMVNLNQIVQEGLYFLETRCTRQGIELVRLLDPNLPEITADAAQLHQVLVNLTVNAIQAMPNGGKLFLRTARSGQHISLTVEDTGMGMSEEVMKRIFMPFFTTKDVGQGIGLGLAVVHGIVTGHRGSVKVQSTVGEGSRFEVLLPVSGPEDKEEVTKE
jgi:two-component system NtrC family sensor kinase